MFIAVDIKYIEQQLSILRAELKEAMILAQFLRECQYQYYYVDSVSDRVVWEKQISFIEKQICYIQNRISLLEGIVEKVLAIKSITENQLNDMKSLLNALSSR